MLLLNCLGKINMQREITDQVQSLLLLMTISMNLMSLKLYLVKDGINFKLDLYTACC